MTVAFADIETAATRLAGHVVRTPMLFAPKLSDMTGAELYVKMENLQVTNSFKDRGAFNRMQALSTSERARGAIAMSAGNHAQAVAYHAKRLGIPATIVMPETTPFTKVERTRAHGAEIILSGETLADSQVTTEAIAAERGLTLIHPYDDDLVIAGQGTVGMEMLADNRDLDILVVPIGGGGLISGVAIAAKHLKPEISVIGVEVKLFPSMYNAVRGQTARCGGTTLAEGIAVKNVTDRTVSICKQLVDDIRLVGETKIERAVNAYVTHQKVLSEGAGAAGLAAVIADRDFFRGKKVGLVLCGGNIDSRLLASVIYRELERERRIVNLRIRINDRPGVLGRIATLLGEQNANILEVSHRRMFLDISAKGAELDIMMETRDAGHAGQIVKMVQSQGFDIEILDAPGGQATELEDD